jgi:hypothetical protein
MTPSKWPTGPTTPPSAARRASSPWRSGSYAAGFGGHRKDDEMHGEGNWYDFGDYGYNPRTGRRPRPDPLAPKYVALSPYVGFGNNPIYIVDTDGRKIKPTDQESKDATIRVVNHFNTEEQSGAQLFGLLSIEVSGETIYTSSLNMSLKKFEKRAAKALGKDNTSAIESAVGLYKALSTPDVYEVNTLSVGQRIVADEGFTMETQNDYLMMMKGISSPQDPDNGPYDAESINNLFNNSARANTPESIVLGDHGVNQRNVSGLLLLKGGSSEESLVKSFSQLGHEWVPSKSLDDQNKLKQRGTGEGSLPGHHPSRFDKTDDL